MPDIELNEEEQKAVKRAAELNRDLMSKIGSTPGEHLTPLSMLRCNDKGEPIEGTVWVMVPVKSKDHPNVGIFYRPHYNGIVELKPGPQEVPEHFLELWWLKANGVVPFEQTQAKPKANAAFAPGDAKLSKADDNEKSDADADKQGKGKKVSN